MRDPRRLHHQSTEDLDVKCHPRPRYMQLLSAKIASIMNVLEQIKIAHTQVTISCLTPKQNISRDASNTRPAPGPINFLDTSDASMRRDLINFCNFNSMGVRRYRNSPSYTNNSVLTQASMMTSIDTMVRHALQTRSITPKMIPVKLIAKGRDNAPAPRVALQRLETEPG